MRIDELFHFMQARHEIYLLRATGAPRPWTADAILRNYRFCNVYRQLDKETIWIMNEWLKPNQHEEDVWFATLMARVVNWSPTLAALGYPDDWSAGKFIETIELRGRLKQKVWTGAYMITTHKKPGPKSEYYANLLGSAWRMRRFYRPKDGATLYGYYCRLMDIDGIGSFIAGQVIADLKYLRPCPLFKAKDWKTWSAPGTGSIRGMNRVLGRPPQLGIDSQMWVDTMKELQIGVAARMERSRIVTEPLHAQDLQNCLCEFDKYERARLGQGRPRATYDGVGL